MTLFDDPDQPVDPAKQLADNLLKLFNREIDRRIDLYRQSFKGFWHTPGVEPQAILDELGTNAAVWLQIGNTDLKHIDAILAMRGQSLDDYLSPEDYTPPRPLTIHEDGTVTVN